MSTTELLKKRETCPRAGGSTGAQLPFEALYLFAPGAADAKDGTALMVPLAEGQGHARAIVYVTGEQRHQLGVEAICRRACCQRVIRLALPLVEVA